MCAKSLKPLKRGNLSETVYSEIREALMEGRYQPGERLRISQLAEELEVSITPVREAIFRLVSDRALEMKAATAVHVPEMTPDQLKDIQTIRSLLEGEAAAQAAQKATPEQVAKLEKIQKDFQKAVDEGALQSAFQNRRFHFEVISIANAPLLYATVENMWVLMGPLLRIYHEETPKRQSTSEKHDHFEVIEGIRNRDSERAKRALQQDISLGLNLAKWIEARQAAKTD